MRYLSDNEEKKALEYIAKVAEVAQNATCERSKCGSGKAVSFNEIVSILNNVLRLNRTPEYIENPYEGVYQTDTECGMSLAKEKIGFIPEYSIEKGIGELFGKVNSR